VNPRTGDRKEIVGGRRRIGNWTYDRDRTKVAYVATSIYVPTELFVSDLSGAAPERQLTHFNQDLNNTVAWSPGERFTFKSVRDVEVEAWLVKPYGYEPGKKYPLVLYIHGGPHSAYNEGWFDEFQNLAGAGMFVLYTNPRGSSGYGAEFQDMIRNRWGDEDYMDLMKAVDICVARPDVDAARLGVTGRQPAHRATVGPQVGRQALARRRGRVGQVDVRGRVRAAVRREREVLRIG